MTPIRSIALTLALAITGAALAQYTPTESFRDLVANDIDAIAITCPAWANNPTDAFPYPASCLRITTGSAELVRMQLERVVRSYYDLTWSGPWMEHDNGSYSRGVVMDGPPEQRWAFFTTPFDTREHIVIIAEHLR